LHRHWEWGSSLFFGHRLQIYMLYSTKEESPPTPNPLPTGSSTNCLQLYGYFHLHSLISIVSFIKHNQLYSFDGLIILPFNLRVIRNELKR
jgi:hypothetical protein